MDRVCAILRWIGRLGATGSAGLATYVAFHPDIAGAYGRMGGVLAVGLFGGGICLVAIDALLESPVPGCLANGSESR
jgi:hypothetical protein